MTSNRNHNKMEELFKKSKVRLGDSVVIETKNATHVGILIPRYEYADVNHLVLKLKNGYNIGINLEKIKSIKKIPEKLDPSYMSDTDHKYKDNLSDRDNVQDSPDSPDPQLPHLSLLSTGGTISSKIDYRTGGVMAALTAKELNDSIPELKKIANIDPEVVLSEYSENIKPEHWTLIARKVADNILSGKYDGIIVSHGTDTMHYTSAALSFALQNLPVPIVLVGAQRSSDRPSSDASLNLVGACTFAARSRFSGVFVAMHHSISDDVIACHIGTRVRKNHTSRRDAFHSIDVYPFSLIKKDQIEISKQYADLKFQVRDKNLANMIVRPSFADKVSLLKFYPGFDCKMIDYCVESGHKAIILEGTGLGHINKECFSQIKNAVSKGIFVFMTSQCIWGRTSLTVYDTGRDLLNIGVIPLSNTTSETALVKAMWCLGNFEEKDVIKTMTTNIANEYTNRIIAD
ncbi:MAG: Glu-tRNA(Gln) amidotransferase subunit GatD [Nitrososphaeraceae archaeon]|nr:Glu-tRNA(Gln) amidotransferase subunit GatD [Nitrososphaeraceae archaeon]MDW0138940.1 Glu-tRNA(Gln) amidotransferase subunit GatD [Nitrososphaeraceae archaeon]MDW0146248.1 Glu-tRNA(Gln) amidotransferase subunit GatD [Nitrososphaeraceae archaeon]MDW0153982.1 Glu-tRNA(Gln) amidotransferase subunit GatD [Nitrososphaeraceae archaeon]